MPNLNLLFWFSFFLRLSSILKITKPKETAVQTEVPFFHLSISALPLSWLHHWVYPTQDISARTSQQLHSQPQFGKKSFGHFGAGGTEDARPLVPCSLRRRWTISTCYDTQWSSKLKAFLLFPIQVQSSSVLISPEWEEAARKYQPSENSHTFLWMSLLAKVLQLFR